jgi:hypothetical protein
MEAGLVQILEGALLAAGEPLSLQADGNFVRRRGAAVYRGVAECD